MGKMGPKSAGERSLGGIFRGAEGRGALEGGFQLGGVQGAFLLGSLLAVPILWQPWGRIPGQVPGRRAPCCCCSSRQPRAHR